MSFFGLHSTSAYSVQTDENLCFYILERSGNMEAIKRTEHGSLFIVTVGDFDKH